MANLTESLLTTLMGMGLVFVVIILLWGLMIMLVRITVHPKEMRPEEQVNQNDDHISSLRKRAAAAAVAFALQTSNNLREIHEFPLPPTPIVSAWHAVLRSRMLNKRR